VTRLLVTAWRVITARTPPPWTALPAGDWRTLQIAMLAGVTAVILGAAQAVMLTLRIVTGGSSYQAAFQTLNYVTWAPVAVMWAGVAWVAVKQHRS
jgi:hypothetical protein